MLLDYVCEIEKLKKQNNAVILAHYYTVPEVQQIADFVGDSLALSQAAADCEADVILFAGVHFMAQTAKILSPNKIVLIPDLDAGCSLAESCDAEAFKLFCEQHPDHKVVSYVNTTAAVKALTDVTCTSSNALKIMESFPEEQPIIFAPDRNLGSYIKKITGRQNMVLWDGACHVHEEFSAEAIADMKKIYPEALVLAHPECKAPVLIMADFIGSTAALLDYCTKSENTEFIIATEPGILYQMKKDNPNKNFYPVPGKDSSCGCNDCSFMKLITLPKIYKALKNMTPQIIVEEEIRVKAEKAVRNMLEIK